MHEVTQEASHPRQPRHLHGQLPDGPRPRPRAADFYVHAHLRDPAQILAGPQVRDIFDFSRPVALVLVAVLHFLPDEDKPAQVVTTLLDALPPGSYHVASRTALDHAPAPVAAMERAAHAGGTGPSNATPATSPGSRSRAWNLSRRASSSSPSPDAHP